MLAFLLLACSDDPVDCGGPDNVLAEVGTDVLQCRTAQIPIAAIETLGGRGLSALDEERTLKEVRRRWREDPAGTSEWIADLQEMFNQLHSASSLDTVVLRSTYAHRATVGEGPLRIADGVIGTILKRALSVWSTSDPERLVLTEMDIEGWIFYASLCREVQSGGPLRVSVSDRLTMYRIVQTRFEEGTREEKIALAGLGPFWRSIQQAWGSASYEQQQSWIKAAPLPPPMTASSLGYFEAVLDGNVHRHVQHTHTMLGPLHLTGK